MSKNNSNGNGTGQSGPPTVHLILQGKGGVGKSVVASWLAEFLIKRGQLVRCIDGDPVNRSFWQYKAFAAEKLDLLNAEGCWRGVVMTVLSNASWLRTRYLSSIAVQLHSSHFGATWLSQI